MSRTVFPSATSGQALVRLKDGRVYEGYAVYDGHCVRVDGRLRTVTNGVVTYRRPRKLTVPLHRLHVIDWL